MMAYAQFFQNNSAAAMLVCPLTANTTRNGIAVHDRFSVLSVVCLISYYRKNETRTLDSCESSNVFSFYLYESLRTFVSY